MAESSQEKTEPPTPKKLREARERGQVPRSQDLTTGLLLALAIGVMAVTAPSTVNRLEAAARGAFEAAMHFDAAGGASDRELLGAAGAVVLAGLMTLVPVFLALTLGALAFSFAQVGAMITAEPLTPKLERMNPIAGLKRMFFGIEAWVELAKSTAKLLIVAVVAYKVVEGRLGLILTSLRLPPLEGAKVVGGIVFDLAAWIVGGVLALGLVDLFYQRWKHEKDLRMSKQEIKEEYKSSEGDPQHKAKRKRAHKEVLETSIVQQVEKAHMVVTNPTHYACALRYDPDEEGAPRLLVKGQDHLAFRIIAMAKELGIPIVRNVPLARALFDLEEDAEVPEELYDAAAELMRSLQELAHAEGHLMPWEGEGEV